MEPTSLTFARAARSLAEAAREQGLSPPTFRSPPRVEGVTRTIRRTPEGVTVSVVLRGRPWAAVAADMIDGVVATNHLSGVAADQARVVMWEALAQLDEEAA